jgi:hypothetical protein
MARHVRCTSRRRRRCRRCRWLQLKKYFTFEVTVLDDKNVHRRFRASNYQVRRGRLSAPPSACPLCRCRRGASASASLPPRVLAVPSLHGALRGLCVRAAACVTAIVVDAPCGGPFPRNAHPCAAAAVAAVPATAVSCCSFCIAHRTMCTVVSWRASAVRAWHTPSLRRLRVCVCVCVCV